MKSKKNKDGAWYAMPLATAAVFVLCMALGGIGYFEFTPPEKTCVSCHEIRASHDRWAHSAHRNVSCKACHGDSADSFYALKENANRVLRHLTQTRHDSIRLSEEQTVRMVQSCRACHAREFAYWQQSGHGTNYAAIFMDEKHNRTEQMADQCLLCHGMFFEGGMSALATPLDTRGPWRFRNPEMAGRPAIPCLACHELHAPGRPFSFAAADAARTPEHAQTTAFRRDILAFYARPEKRHFAADDLSVPKIVEKGRPVRVSSDPRQRLCTECHAPNAFGEAGTSDDRTPRGVHEGLSCAACHAPHSNDTRASCASCHPRFSSCGRDVTAMDTTFRSRTSKHNIHTVTCAECHPNGVPKRP